MSNSKPRIPQNWHSLPRLWRWCVLLCLVIGIGLRIINLGDKVFWYDEAFTALRVSGYTEAEVVQAVSIGEPVRAAVFQRYQQLNSHKTLFNTVQGLAAEEPQHTPLYFVLARLWADWFGDSITSLRSLSIAASVLAIPLMGWLCWELFASPAAASIGMLLLAVSPFQVAYAQEARPTALWTLTTLLTSVALLRAMRSKAAVHWTAYALASTVNFYTYLFSILVAQAHLLYVAGVERFRLRRNLRFILAALGLATLAFAPWLLAIAQNQSQVETVTNWLAVENRFTLGSFGKLWAYHLSLPFVDRGELVLPLPLRAMVSAANLLVRVGVLYGLYLLCRRTPFRVWWFVVSLIAVPAIALTLPDLIYGGKRSTIPRYFVPVYIGFELALTYLLSRQLWDGPTVKRWQRHLWQGVALVIVIVGIGSSAAIATSPSWWHKVHNRTVPALAAQINQSPGPLVISDAEVGDLFALTHYLNPDVPLLVRPQCYACDTHREWLDQPYLPPLPDGVETVFLFNPRPSEAWLTQLNQQQTYTVKPLAEGFNNWLWQIQPPSG